MFRSPLHRSLPVRVATGICLCLALAYTLKQKNRLARPVVEPDAAGVGILGDSLDFSSGSKNSPELAKSAVLDKTEAISVDWPVLAEFRSWAENYVRAEASEKSALLAPGIALASKRRPVLHSLIKQDPERALEQALPRVLRQDLPQEVLVLLEQPVSARGDFNVYRGRPQEALTEADVKAAGGLTLRYFETAEKSYFAHVFGQMDAANTAREVPLRGVAIERDMAVASSAVRELERGERLPAGTTITEVCPVSDEKTTLPPTADEATPVVVTDETPTVEVAGELIRLCNGAHVKVLDERVSSKFAMASGGPGGASFFRDAMPGTSSEALGNFRALYIRVTYPDQMRAPNTEAEAYLDMDNVQRFFLENSHGKLTTTTSVTPLIVLPHSKDWYIAKDAEVDGLGLVHSHSRSVARRLGYDSNQFNVTIVRVNGGPRLSGISWGGGDSVWVSWDGMDVINHEAGHSLGRNHANYWDTGGKSAIGPGENAEYGNGFDVMGGGGGFSAHYNTLSKRSLGWLPDRWLHQPTANGNYRIFAYDQPVLKEGNRYGIRLTKDARRTYHLEYHYQHGAGNASRKPLTNSAILLTHWSDKSNAGHLIDTTPGTPAGKTDGGIDVGRTFSDWESNLHFTVTGRNDTVPPSLDVQCMKGPFPGNRPPVLALTASATQVAVGGSLTFTAAATDADGDTLAYHWDFEDGELSRNVAEFTRSFPATNQITVLCTVSDMRGGLARGHVVVNVGSPGRSVVSGQITDAGGQPIMGVLVMSDTSKYTYSDSDGRYALSDLTSGDRTLTATLEGYSFTPSFTNPLTVPANNTVTGNWSASGLPTLEITVAAAAAEPNTVGRFVITRTGATDADQIVHVTSALGTAVRGTDYTFSPNYVDNGSFRDFVIPAGSDRLEVLVQPMADTSAEGPETITLSLAGIDGMRIANNGSATMNLEDDDTLLPQVSIVTELDEAKEGGSGGRMVLRRTGATTAALAVPVTVAGTASNGLDVPQLASPLTIPIGQAFITIPIAATDDTATEGTEELTVTVSSSATYVRSASSQTAKLNLIDNDMPNLTVLAADATASEAEREPGVFLITRSGATTAPLLVYYGLRGSAAHGQDYLALNGQVTIPAGQAQAAVVISPYDDAHGEGPETVTLQLANFDGTYTPTEPFSGSITITDNADAPLLTVDSNSSTIGEPNDTGVFTITLKGSRTTPTTVAYTLSGTATNGVDYQLLSGTVQVPAPTNGQSTMDVTITPIDDTVVENAESVTLSITPNPAAYTVYGDAQATAILRDNDAPTVHISRHSDGLAEPAAHSSFYIHRTDAAGGLLTTGVLTVNFAISGTATPGADYVAIAGSIDIPEGASGIDIPATVVNDTLVEGAETLTLSLLDAATYSVGIATATHVLSDDEAEPADSAVRSVGFQTSASATTEEPNPTTGTNRSLTVTLSAAAPTPVTVDVVASSGSSAVGDDVDWALLDPATNEPTTRITLTFPANTNTSQTVPIRVNNDGIIETDETAVLTLQNAAGGRISSSRGSHTLTISDNLAANPAPRVAFVLPTAQVPENASQAVMVIAALDQPSSTTHTVNYRVTGNANLGSDFTGPSSTTGTLTFGPETTAVQIPLSILPDTLFEGDETAIFTLEAPSSPLTVGGNSSQAVTILDDDKPVLSLTSVDPTEQEEGKAINFVLSRVDGPVNTPVTLSYQLSGTATSGTDYAMPSGSVTLPSGSTTAIIAVQTLSDSSVEPAETLTLSLTATTLVTLQTTSQTATIVDTNGPPQVAIRSPLTSPVLVAVGNGLEVEAEATRPGLAGSNAVPGTWSQVSGPSATIDSPDQSTTGIRFSAPGAYIFRYTAANGPDTAFADFSATYGGFAGQQIGTTTAAGSYNRNGNSITITAAGSGLSSSGTADGFYFVPIPVAGDFDIRCRVTSLVNPGASTSCRIAIMARDGAAANAAYVASLFRGNLRADLQYRTTTGLTAAASQGTTSYTLPRWLRLTRSGNAYSAYHGDGTTWTMRGTAQTINLGATPLVGLAFTSAVVASASTVVIDSLNVNQAPHVQLAAAPTAAPWPLQATLTHDDAPSTAYELAWSKASGPGNVTFSTPSSLTTNASFTATGAYLLRLTANDNGARSFAETTVNAIGIAQPIETWRANTFGGQTPNTLVSGDFADPDRDGINNIMEYALGSSPLQSSALPQIQAQTASTVSQSLKVRYTRNLAATDVSSTWEASSSLQNGWSAANPTISVISTNGDQQTVEATFTSPTATRQFYRLSVHR